MFSYPIRPTLLALAAGAVLAGCGSLGGRTADTPAGREPAREPAKREAAVVPPYTGGGYYKDDGPGANPPANLGAIPDAEPRDDPMHPFANRVYKVKGKRYVPDVSGQPYKERGLASWYGRKFHGKPTSSGEVYDMYAMSAAHRTLPIPSYARVTNVDSGASVVVRINDRGPFHPDRLIDLSYTAAHKLDVLRGVTLVEVERLFPDQEEAPVGLRASAGPADGAETAGGVLTQPLARAEIAEVVRAPTAQSYYLQVGAYGNPQAADDLTERLTRGLGRVIPGVLRLDEGGLIKVRVGPFTSLQAADAAVELVRGVSGNQPFRLAADAPPAPAPAQPAVAGDGGPTTWWLQLAALSRPEAADALLERFRGANLPGLEKHEEQGLIKVRAGPFQTAALADEAAGPLTELLGQRPYRLTR